MKDFRIHSISHKSSTIIERIHQCRRPLIWNYEWTHVTGYPFESMKNVKHLKKKKKLFRNKSKKNMPSKFVGSSIFQLNYHKKKKTCIYAIVAYFIA